MLQSSWFKNRHDRKPDLVPYSSRDLVQFTVKNIPGNDYLQKSMDLKGQTVEHIDYARTKFYSTKEGYKDLVYALFLQLYLYIFGSLQFQIICRPFYSA